MKRQMKSRRVAWGLGLLVTATAAAAAAILLQVGTVGASTGTGPVTSMNAAVSDALAAHGITTTAVSDGSVVSADAAVKEAGATFAFAASQTPTESLVQFTDSEQGPEQADGTIKPIYANTEAWAIVYRGIQVPTLGGGPYGMDGKLPPTHTADFVVFVDAHTGQYLTAIAMGS